MSAYTGTTLAISGTFYVVLLRHVKQKTKNSSVCGKRFKLNKDNNTDPSYRGGNVFSINCVFNCFCIWTS